MHIVELEQVEKTYRDVRALNGLSLALPQGEVLGLFGHNGAGKTTAIKLMLGLIEASRGQVRVLGRSPTSPGARMARRYIGFLPENVSFYPQLTGLEVLRYFARLKGLNPASCQHGLELVGLGSAAQQRVKTYSKGMRQRLGLAQALLGEPKLLLLDEPTVGLDPLATQDFYHRLKTLRDRGCTVILCSHVLPGVEQYLDRALILSRGRMLAQGSLAQLREQAALPMRLRLIGSNIALPSHWQAQAQPSTEGVQIELDLTQKLPALQQLIGLAGVTDFDLQLPTLEDLYRHFIQPRATVSRSISRLNQEPGLAA